MTTSSPLTPAHFRRALLAALALGIGVAPGHAVAASGPAGTSEGETITTVLYPGWNLVGWLGHEALVTDLFDAIPTLQQVSAWDADDGAYRHAVRRRYDELPTVKPATALWLRLRGDMTVEWTRPAGPDGVLLRLSEGINLVAVADPGAVGRLDTTGTTIWRWDAPQQQYALYPSAQGKLRRGDAILVEAPSARNGWQTGTAPPPISFFGDVPAEKQQAILAEYAQMETFFAEQFGRTARSARYYIANDPQTARQVYQAIYQVDAPANVPGLSFQGRVIEVLAWESTDGQGERRLREHEPPYLVTRYYSRQAVGIDSPGPRQPAWLTSGMSAYARLQFDASIGVEDYADVGARERRAARRTALALAGIDADNVRDDGVGSLTFLAAEWLVDQAGSDAIAYYHRLLSSSSDSSWAFETAFGMSVGGFDESFEAYRAEHFPPDPHRAEEGAGGPSLVFLGDVAADVREEVEAELDNVQAFFVERFDAELPGYTIYAGADTDAVREAFPTYSFNGWCGDRLWQAQTIIALNRCGEWRLDAFAAQALTGGNGSSPGPGPAPPWLYEGAERYATREYQIAAGRLDRARHQAVLIAVVKYEAGSLQDGEDSSRTTGSVAQWLGELAAELLAERAGEPAVFRYFQDPIPTEDIWRERFEAAFGITVDAFYEEFEEHRAGLMLP